MILVIILYYLLKVSEGSHDSEPVPTLDQVVQPSHHQDPHGCALPLVVYGPGLYQVSLHSTRNSDPVHMDSVRAAKHSRVSWLLEVVKLGCAHSNAQAIARSGCMGELAG